MGQTDAIGRPAPSEYAPAYGGYIDLVPEAGSVLLTVLGDQIGQLAQVAAAVPADREAFAYAPGKWTVREVFAHLIDVERIFGYRAYCLSRGDAGPFPGFDDEAYVARSGANRRTVADLAAEFGSVRQANLLALGPLGPEAWRVAGTANGKPVSTRSLAYMMAGHPRHHLGLLESRYGIRG